MLVLDAAVGGHGCLGPERRLRHALGGQIPAPSAARVRTGRVLEAAGGSVDLDARVLHAGDDHPARLDLGVERLEVRTLGEGRRWLDIEVRADLVADLLAESTSTRSAQPVRVGSAGTKTVATKARRIVRAPTHDAADGLAEEQVRALGGRVGGGTPERGTSTPSLTMLTATSQRGALASPRRNAPCHRVGLRFIAEHDDWLFTG